MISKIVKKVEGRTIELKVVRQAGQPAEIHVQLDNQEAQVFTEERLEQVPEEVRPLVAHLLGHGRRAAAARIEGLVRLERVRHPATDAAA